MPQVSTDYANSLHRPAAKRILSKVAFAYNSRPSSEILI